MSPMVTETTRTMFASCRDGLCDGYTQVPVQGIESHVAFTYGELGGDRATTPQEQMVAQMPEREAIHFRFVDMADEPCPHCGRERIIDPNPRPEYEAKTGMDPLLLRKRELGLEQEKSDRETALDLQRQQLEEARRANDIREREIAARERELEVSVAAATTDDDDEPAQPRPKAKTPA